MIMVEICCVKMNNQTICLDLFSIEFQMREQLKSKTQNSKFKTQNSPSVHVNPTEI